ncbi:MAG: radical SAM-associated putative lipoprotein [Prevotella sp.]|nr:radical SAM-associated putative lipoprotein [Prevotella sp.]
MKVRFNRWYNAVLTALLGLLGFESCDSPDEYGPIPCEYGTPCADYQISGIVTDESNSPIKDIKVSAKFVYQAIDGRVETYGVDSTQTDGLGKYAFESRRFYGDPDLKLIVEDIDGEGNGGDFKSDTIDIDYDNAKKVKEPAKGDSWSTGTYAINQDIRLKKK